MTTTRPRRFSTSSTGEDVVTENIYVSDYRLRQRVESERVIQNGLSTRQDSFIVNNNKNNNGNEVQYRKTTSEKKKRRLRLALSCPVILPIEICNSNPTPIKELSSSPCEVYDRYEQTDRRNTDTSQTSEVYDRYEQTNRRNTDTSQTSEVYDIRYEQTNRRNTDTSQTELTEAETVINTQPRSTKKYDSCRRKNYKDENGNISSFEKPRLHHNNTHCDACLYKSRDIVSYCTCYWCLNSLCYHCIKHDDIGYISLTMNDICTCAGSIKTKLKRLAIAATCIPCLPCLTLYPCLNGALSMMIKLRE